MLGIVRFGHGGNVDRKQRNAYGLVGRMFWVRWVQCHDERDGVSWGGIHHATQLSNQFNNQRHCKTIRDGDPAMKNLCVTLLLSIAAFGQIRAKVQTAASGPSVSLTCTGPTSGTPANSFNFLSSLTNGGPYTLLGNVPTCAYTDTSQAFSTTVYYVAQSVNTATCPTGCVSGNSNQATAVIPANPVPNPPTGLTVGTIVSPTMCR